MRMPDRTLKGGHSAIITVQEAQWMELEESFQSSRRQRFVCAHPCRARRQPATKTNHSGTHTSSKDLEAWQGHSACLAVFLCLNHLGAGTTLRSSVLKM